MRGVRELLECTQKNFPRASAPFCSQANCADGTLPIGAMIVDRTGNLYGTTEVGGEYNNGVVFELTP